MTSAGAPRCSPQGWTQNAELVLTVKMTVPVWEDRGRPGPSPPERGRPSTAPVARPEAEGPDLSPAPWRLSGD